VACSWGFVAREKLIEAGITRIANRPLDIMEYIY